MTRRARIAIATNGRFHVLDLARELSALGHDVKFYSMLPDSRAERFGLDRRHCRSVLPLTIPALAWERGAPRLAPGPRERFYNWSLNRAIIARLEPCDVFIGMSGLILEAAVSARRRFGAKLFVERGSKHILAQKAILDARGAAGPSDRAVERELAGYRIADRIVVPAQHAAASFAREPGAGEKLFVNPYGVDLGLFPQAAPRAERRPTVLFVGNWTLQKGCDVLTEAMMRLPDADLLHVGAVGDLPFPEHPRFRHVDPVDQTELHRWYARADVFAIASRQEGLALVQVQALASGLPLVCTTETGGRDLRLSPELARRIDEVPVDDPDALARALAARLEALAALAPLPEQDRQLLSWKHYGIRYAAEIERCLAGGPGG